MRPRSAPFTATTVRGVATTVRQPLAVGNGAHSTGHRPSPWLALAVVLVGSYAAVLNVTVVGVALPAIAADLGSRAGSVDADWVMTGFLLGVVVVHPSRPGWPTIGDAALCTRRAS